MISIDNYDFKGKRAIIRVDFNVPLNEKGEVTDDTRIRAAIPTIKKVLAEGGSVILMSHMGRPKKNPDPKYSLEQIVPAVEKNLGTKVEFAGDCIGEKAAEMAKNLKPGQVMLLENLRFYAEEEGKPRGLAEDASKEEKDAAKKALKEGPQKEFVKKLASLADCYINDAFGTAHRKHASTYLIAKQFPNDKMFGYLMEKEVKAISSLMEAPAHPFCAIVGGSKVSSKIGVIKALIEKVDSIIIGGGMTYTFAAAQGGKVGGSICEPDMFPVALEILELAKKKAKMALFSPYDAERVYGKPFADISVTEHYDEMVADDRIRKTYIDAREFFTTLAEIQFESGYPYIVFEDTVNRANPIAGRITMSNLCSEILQVQEASSYNEDLTYSHVGRDVSCNLGSLNIAKAMDAGLAGTVETAIRALTSVSEHTRIDAVPSICRANDEGHAIGLGQMNLHGFLAREGIQYGSEEALDFTDMYFMTVAYHAYRASHTLAVEHGTAFRGFADSAYAKPAGEGNYFDKYTDGRRSLAPRTELVRALFERFGVAIPTEADWAELRDDILRDGIYNQNLQAVPPTGSISYINHSTSSIHPIASKIEIRKEGKLGRVYYPAAYMTNENLEYYKDAYEIGWKAIVDTYAEATQHVDQGLSLTLFFPDTATTRDLNKAQIYAWRKGIKTLYYIRIRQQALEGTEVQGCVSCML